MMKKLLLKNVYKGFLNEGRKFLNIEEFKKLPPDRAAREKWLLNQKHKEAFLGEGSSRAVFLINSSTVLKFATSDVGQEQNQAEVEIYTDPYMKDVVAKIYDFDSNNYDWLISELVKEIPTRKEWSKLAGDVERPMSGFLSAADVLSKNLGRLNPAQKEYFSKFPPLVHKLAQALAHTNLILNDVKVPGHWGKTADGRLVILDYGYTRDTARYYE